MADHITKCNRCGCREFSVVETLDWRGEVDDAGLLGCTNPWNAIETIRCTACGATYSTEGFPEINFG
jgi:hypothetical protein